MSKIKIRPHGFLMRTLFRWSDGRLLAVCPRGQRVHGLSSSVSSPEDADLS